MHRHRRVPLILTAAGALCASILASALTTSDREWWQYCFSQLGAMGDASSLLFNAGAIIAGVVILAGALSVAISLRSGSPLEFRAHRALSVLLPSLIATLGLSLVLIGSLPLSFNELAHERAANGAIASSAALLIVHRLFLRGLSRALDGVATGATVVLALGFSGMMVGVLSLTAFEALAFGVVLSWLHLLEMRLKRFVPGTEPKLPANSQQLFLSPIWGTRVCDVILESPVRDCRPSLGGSVWLKSPAGTTS
jgi:hypothetical protein